MLNHNLYCQIYVDTEKPETEIITDLAQLLSGEIEYNTIITSDAELDVLKNEDFDVEQREVFPDGFLHFRYYVDVTALPAQQREKQIALVTNILHHFWEQAIPSVAACDYEDALPYQGGYKSELAPWVEQVSTTRCVDLQHASSFRFQ